MAVSWTLILGTAAYALYRVLSEKDEGEPDSA